MLTHPDTFEVNVENRFENSKYELKMNMNKNIEDPGLLRIFIENIAQMHHGHPHYVGSKSKGIVKIKIPTSCSWFVF